jgi:hypothetical protein
MTSIEHSILAAVFVATAAKMRYPTADAFLEAIMPLSVAWIAAAESPAMAAAAPAAAASVALAAQLN